MKKDYWYKFIFGLYTLSHTLGVILDKVTSRSGKEIIYYAYQQGLFMKHLCMMSLTVIVALVLTVNGTTVWAVEPDFDIYSVEQSVLSGKDYLMVASVSNPNNSSQSGNLSVKIGKQTSSGYSYNWEIVTVQITVNGNSTELYEYNFSTLLEGVEPGHYKAYGKFYYKDSYKVAYYEFDVLENQNPDPVDEPEQDSGGKDAKMFLKLLNNPVDVSFGDSTVVGVEMVSSGDVEKVRLVAYIDKPEKVAVDLSGKIIVNKYCYKDSGIEIRKVKGGANYVVALPLFIYDNCDLEMEGGMYRIVARDCVFLDGKWEYGKNKVYGYVNVSGFDRVRCTELLEKKIVEKESGSEVWREVGDRNGLFEKFVDIVRGYFSFKG